MMKKPSLTVLQEYWIERAKENLVIYTEALRYVNPPFLVKHYNTLQHTFSPLKAYPNAQKKQLVLWPRGHTKTESTSINYPCWLIGNESNLHINIVSKTSSLAEDILGNAIIPRLETDENHIKIFGVQKPRHPKKWTSQALIVQRDEISKNPTLKATGLMGPITGGRSDLIICDDIIDEENVRTRLQIEKVITWVFKVLFPTLYPWGAIIFIGTRWSYADIYAMLLEKWPSDVVSILQAIEVKDGKETGKVLWPEYWPLSKLEERREEIGTIFFNCQYQNDPTGMEGDLLRGEWLHAWEQPPPPNDVNYAGVDPALGEGDKQAISVLSEYRPLNLRYLKEVWCDRVPLPLFVEKLRQLHQTYKFAKIFMESNAFQKVLVYSKALEGLPIVPSQTVRDKESRFIGMSSHFESKRVVVNPLMIRRGEFYTEWVQFPRGQYDDALDSVEIVTREVVGKRRGYVII